MSSIGVIGSPTNSIDFANYCKLNSISAIYYDLTSANDLEKAVALWSEKKVTDVLCFHDGRQVLLEEVKGRLGLTTRSIEAIRTLTDKARLKKNPLLEDFICPYLELPTTVSNEEVINHLNSAKLDFPVVIKPSNAFYSAAVIRIDRPEQLASALQQVKRVCKMMKGSRGESSILIEAYLDGEEFAVDGFVRNGEIYPTVLIRKFPKLEGPHFHELAYVVEVFDFEKGKDFIMILRKVILGLGLDHSPFHAEFRYDRNGKLHVLEIAPRLSGAGATADNLLKICHSQSAYDVLLNRSDLFLKKKGPVAVEYDFCATKNGFLKNIESAYQGCKDRKATSILQYCENGKYVFAPPVNVETVLTAFFEFSTRNEAEACVLEIAQNVIIETQ
jgi:hypothetical protein